MGLAVWLFLKGVLRVYAEELDVPGRQIRPRRLSTRKRIWEKIIIIKGARVDYRSYKYNPGSFPLLIPLSLFNQIKLPACLISTYTSHINP